MSATITREQALQLLDRYATAAMDRHCCGDEFQPALEAAKEACFRAFGINTAEAPSLGARDGIEEIKSSTKTNPGTRPGSNAEESTGQRRRAYSPGQVGTVISATQEQAADTCTNTPKAQPLVLNPQAVQPMEQCGLTAPLRGYPAGGDPPAGVVYGGSAPPIRIAIDPYAALGKTWSDK